jgi:hypothetical protein
MCFYFFGWGWLACWARLKNNQILKQNIDAIFKLHVCSHRDTKTKGSKPDQN